MKLCYHLKFWLKIYIVYITSQLFRSTTEVIINKADLSDFIKEQGANKFTPWFLLMSQSMLPKWWDNIGDLKPFIDEENIIKY